MKRSTLLHRLKHSVIYQIILVWAVLVLVPVSMELAH